MTLGTYPAINVSEQDLAERLARALEATAKVINARPVQLIEALPVKQQVSEALTTPVRSPRTPSIGSKKFSFTASLP
jgi:hypothetical protein